jgi:hypothetical protein
MTNALDDIAPAFRRALNRWPEANNIKAHYDDLSRTFENNGSSLIELCKSFLEMVCITVVTELDGEHPKSSRPTTTESLISALDVLGLRSKRGSSALGKIISGHIKIANGISDVRNHEGSVAHGKDGFIDTISDRHARVYLLSTDTIISLILQAYEGVEPSILKTREPHDHFSHHNKKIDESTYADVDTDEDGVIELSFRVGSLDDGFSIRAPASELLFYLDRQAYVDVLDSLRGISIDIEDEEGLSTEETEIVQTKEELNEDKVDEPSEAVLGPSSRRLEPISEYQGKYSDHISSLYEYIMHSIMGGNSEFATKVQNFTYTILNGMEELAVVDWSKRLSTRTEVRLLIKKLIKLFSIEGIDEKSIDQIVEWLAQRIVGGDE